MRSQRGFFEIPDLVIKALPYVIVIAAIGGYSWWLYNKGASDRESAVRQEYATADQARKALRDEIRSDMQEIGAGISSGLEQKVLGIRELNKSVTQMMKTEKEIHHVLTSDDCAWPLSTVQLRNRARVESDNAGREPRAVAPAAVPSAAPAAR